MTDEEYVQGDEFDWDQSDPRQRCKHGTFIGSSWGPDIMCHACEMGHPDPTINEVLVGQALKAESFQEHWVLVGKLVAKSTGEESALLVEYINKLSERHKAELAAYDAEVEEISKWAEDGDDDDWSRVRHAAEIQGMYEKGK